VELTSRFQAESLALLNKRCVIATDVFGVSFVLFLLLLWWWWWWWFVVVVVFFVFVVAFVLFVCWEGAFFQIAPLTYTGGYTTQRVSNSPFQLHRPKALDDCFEKQHGHSFRFPDNGTYAARGVV